MARSRDREGSYPRGTILDGKFRIERVLGAGGMGVVLEATHLALGQVVALKLLRDEATEDGETLRRFVQEAQVASALVSENVVRVFDLGHTERGEPYIVMELLEGEDLADLVARVPQMPVATAVDLMLGACLGVASAHAAGLVHRDLKPANLFLALRPDGSRVVKVLDFGLSKVTRPGDAGLTASASSFGTPQYMAPEQITSVKHVDARCDQHALGMVLHELLTGRPAFEGDSPGAICVKIATHPPPSARAVRGDVPAALDAAIRRSLAKLPDDRFEDLGGFACAIAPFGGADTVRAAALVHKTLGAARGRTAAPLDERDPTTIALHGGAAHRPSSLDAAGGVSSSLRKRTRRAYGFGAAAGLALLTLGGFALLRAGAPAPASAAASSLGSKDTLDGTSIAARDHGVPLARDPGPVSVGAIHHDGSTWSRPVLLAEGRAVLVAVPAPGAAAPDAPPPAASHVPWPAIAAAGVGVTGLGFMTGFGLAAASSNADSVDLQRGCVTGQATACREGEAARDAAQTQATVATVGFGVGVAGLTLGAVLWLLDDDDPPALAASASGSRQIAIEISPERVGAHTTISF